MLEPVSYTHLVYSDPTHIAAAGKIISEAKNPVILAGAGAVRGHAAAAGTELADRLHIPVVNTMMAKGIIPLDDKYKMCIRDRPYIVGFKMSSGRALYSTRKFGIIYNMAFVM